MGAEGTVVGKKGLCEPMLTVCVYRFMAASKVLGEETVSGANAANGAAAEGKGSGK